MVCAAAVWIRAARRHSARATVRHSRTSWISFWSKKLFIPRIRGELSKLFVAFFLFLSRTRKCQGIPAARLTVLLVWRDELAYALRVHPNRRRYENETCFTQRNRAQPVGLFDGHCNAANSMRHNSA